MNSLPVTWSDADFIDLDYVNQFGSPLAPFSKYTNKIYEQIIKVGNYSKPKTMPLFVDKICESFDYKTVVPAINKMEPGMCLPPHQDAYERFMEVYKVSDASKIDRYLVLLQDSSPGQMVQIDKDIIGYWKKGNYIGWSGHTQHAAYNLSAVDRYALQVTCFDKI
tara:strand:- start:1376 stop:1870 length:495 start_codon:yes stop_codon:yes gene_type:complete